MASKDEEGQMYSGRHDHKLCSLEGLSPYTCSGCKEYGANVGFQCHICPDFILHEACAKLSDDYVHPLYGQYRFQFRRKTHLRRHCDACGEVVRGFVFKSRSAHLRLHPLCMALPPLLNYGGHKDHGLLKLITEKDGKHPCMKCNTMNSNWRYLCENTTCALSIDFNCAKVDFLKLSDHGIATVSPPSRGKQFVEKFSNISNWVAGNVGQGTVTGPVGTAIPSLFGADEDGPSPPTDGDGPPPQTDGDWLPRPPPPTKGDGFVGTTIPGLFRADKDGSRPPPPTEGDGLVGTAIPGVFRADKDGSRPPPPTKGDGLVGTAIPGFFRADKDGSRPPPPTKGDGLVGTAIPGPFGADKDGRPHPTNGDGRPPPTQGDGHPPPTHGDEDEGEALGNPADGDGDEDEDEEDEDEDEDNA